MLFMGQEAGEYLQFSQHRSDWVPLAVYETDPGRSKVRLWWRRSISAAAMSGGSREETIKVTHLSDANGVIAVSRGGGKYLNLKPGDWDHYDVGVAGRYQELANTSWPAFDLGNYPEPTRGGDRAFITDVPGLAYGALVLVRSD